MAPPVAAERGLPLPIRNDSGLALMEIYAAPSGEETWSDDLLGARVLPSGRTRVVTIPDGGSACSVRFRLVFEDGRDVLDAADACGPAGFRLAPRPP